MSSQSPPAVAQFRGRGEVGAAHPGSPELAVPLSSQPHIPPDVTLLVCNRPCWEHLHQGNQQMPQTRSCATQARCPTPTSSPHCLAPSSGCLGGGLPLKCGPGTSSFDGHQLGYRRQNLWAWGPAADQDPPRWRESSRGFEGMGMNHAVPLPGQVAPDSLSLGSKSPQRKFRRKKKIRISTSHTSIQLAARFFPVRARASTTTSRWRPVPCT